MRYRLRRDANHVAVTRALKQCGALVVDLSTCGRGVPDLLVAFRGSLYLVEIKNLRKNGGRGKVLTPAQVAFHRQMQRYVTVVTSVDEARRFLLERGVQAFCISPGTLRLHGHFVEKNR